MNNNNELNAFTASMLMNKSSYNKYLEKTAPKIYKEKQEYLGKLKKNKSRILNILTEYLEEPDKDFSLEVNTSLYDFGKVAIKYLEILDLDKKGGGCYEMDDPDDSDSTMFYEITETNETNETNETHSFWGKPIKKSTDFIGVYNNYNNYKNGSIYYTKNMETTSKKKNKKKLEEYEEEYGEYDETAEREITEEDLA
jgi:hypothetical protein